ncbi:MAG: hypothetical protein PHN36_04050, partial [Patescibacteria group bacterium]|nr:hypothetical protein [Patescibacteria group bacterium]
KGDTVGILGQTLPNSKVNIYVYSDDPIIESLTADKVGAYFYDLDTDNLDLGEHTTKSKAYSSDGVMTDFSKTLFFSVLDPSTPLPKKKNTEGCANFNLNCDFITKVYEEESVKNDKINFVDVSILLYNWGSKPKNTNTDLNKDGVVNYRDLSILLYYWTG